MDTERTVPVQAKGGVGRRGVIAGAAALAAALIAKQASAPVEAADGGNIVIGAGGNANNTFMTATTLTSTVATTPSSVGLRVKGTSNVATPDTTYDAIQGYTQAAQNAGTLGRNDDLNGIGAVGVASNGTGVYAQSTSGTALGGVSTSGAGVYSVSTSGPGVNSISVSNYGVYGQSTSSTGVYGLSTSSYGGVFITSATTAGQYGVLGGANGAGLAAFGGANPNAGGYAAYFTGNVKITGGKLFLDSQTLQSLNAHSDGSKRVTYGVQAAEPTIEDIGEGSFANGTADVALDPAFTGIVATDQYHVFLTEYDGNNSLYVTGRKADGFSVRTKSGSGSGTFSWRVVAKPRDAGKTQRLAKQTLADLKVPTVDELHTQLKESNVAPLPNRKGSGTNAPPPAAPAAPPSNPNPVPNNRTPDVNVPVPAAPTAPSSGPNPLPPKR